jgi:hypothetical protein
VCVVVRSVWGRGGEIRVSLASKAPGSDVVARCGSAVGVGLRLAHANVLVAAQALMTSHGQIVWLPLGGQLWRRSDEQSHSAGTAGEGQKRKKRKYKNTAIQSDMDFSSI